MVYNISMNYLVVRPYQQNLCSVSIVMGDDVEITGFFESWALNDGKKVLFANTRLHKLVKDHYMMGAFSDKANYAYTYEEMCGIVTTHIGPSDRVRYETSLQEYNEFIKSKPAPVNKYFGAYALWELTKFCTFFVYESIKLVATLIIIPIIAAFISRPK